MFKEGALIARISAPILLAAAMMTTNCSNNKEAASTERQESSSTVFGKTPAGETVNIYTLKNSKGAEARIMNYGGVLVSFKVPDKSGNMSDIVLGFDDFKGYLLPPPYFGALIGRYGNRIGHAKFSLDGKEYTLAKNDGDNTLHGGLRGFDKVLWTATPSGNSSLELKYLSKDGEEGFPGNLNVTVVYSLSDSNELKLDYTATTDKDTVLNLTNHSYWNLKGEGQGDILDHVVMIAADKFTPVDKGLIPTGQLENVAGTPFDFREPHAIGERINDQNQQLIWAKGYDQNFVLNKVGDLNTVAARVTEPTSGRVMEVLTTEPGLQFYTGNFLDGTIHGKGGAVYNKHAAFCMETQHFPDSPNKPSFPSVELKPGETYHTTTVYRFSTK